MNPNVNPTDFHGAARAAARKEAKSLAHVLLGQGYRRQGETVFALVKQYDAIAARAEAAEAQVAALTATIEAEAIVIEAAKAWRSAYAYVWERPDMVCNDEIEDAMDNAEEKIDALRDAVDALAALSADAAETEDRDG